jgi:two-component system response regulator FixJ
VLIRAIRKVAAGRESWPEVADDHADRDAEHRYERLTPRQREIFYHVVHGRTNRAMAERLGISVKTVEVHRAAVTRRLGMPDVASLTRLGVRLGIVPP